MRNKVVLDMMDKVGCDCKCIVSESDGSNTLQLYMSSVGLNPVINLQWEEDGAICLEKDTGNFLESGEFYYSANPEFFIRNRLITFWVTWTGGQSRNIYFQCVNLTEGTNYTVTRDLSAADMYRVAASEEDTIPIATTTSTGIVQIGEGINVDEKGIISMPKATTTSLGAVIVGEGLEIDKNGVLTCSGGSISSERYGTIVAATGVTFADVIFGEVAENDG